MYINLKIMEKIARLWWLKPKMLATQETEI
jgi:hypothetical protein